MKILLVYASNSGSTFQVAEEIAAVLSVKHEVVLKKATKAAAEKCVLFDVVILGSASWSVEGHEGYPLPSMLKLLRAMQGKEFPNQRFALFGCGDTSYTYFCGAVDYMVNVLAECDAKSIIEPLKIDSFYFDLPKTVVTAEEWAHKLLTKLR